MTCERNRWANRDPMCDGVDEDSVMLLFCGLSRFFQAPFWYLEDAICNDDQGRGVPVKHNTGAVMAWIAGFLFAFAAIVVAYAFLGGAK